MGADGINPPGASDEIGGVGGGPMAPLGSLEGVAEDLGGGGVDVEVGVDAAAPARLLTHFFNCSS
jgi:hypothetical protein